jgi:hypothetical protein
MLTVKFDPSAAKSQLNRVKSSIRDSMPEMLDECGKRLVGLARIYFDNLSAGGSGYSGRQWPALNPATVKRRQSMAKRGLLRAPVGAMGIVTGAMRESLQYDASNDRLKVSYSDSASKFFNVHRRLIPSTLPKPWRKACDEIISDRLDSLS